MDVMVSQITSLTIVCSIVYSGANQRKHQSSTSLAFVRGIHRWPVKSPHKRPVTRKMVPFDDVIICHCHPSSQTKVGLVCQIKCWPLIRLSKREIHLAWWRHQMEIFSALLAICVGNSPDTGEFPAQRPVTRSFDDFFDLRLNKRLSKQSIRRWVETPLHLLWHRCNYLHFFATLRWWRLLKSS